MSKNRVRYPVNGTFELTGRCNLSCKMCLVRVDDKRICELGSRERTAKEWIDMARQVRDAGTLGLLLTGGEVMMRPDFAEIYEAVSRMGFVLTLYTNATMVTENVMETLRKYPPHKIGVTMYGASNETYAAMCGCKDGYDRFVEGVGKLSKLPSLFDVRTTIIKDNLHDLPAMKAFAKREFDQTITISRFVTNAVRGGVADPKRCRLTPEENVELVHCSVMDLWRRVQAGKMQLPEVHEKFKAPYYTTPKEGQYLFEHCGAGMNSYNIMWDGRMYACELLNQGYTEPFRTGFADAWEHLPEQYPLSELNTVCEQCRYSELCEACPATRLAETGDWCGIPEYSCREARYLYQIMESLKLI